MQRGKYSIMLCPFSAIDSFGTTKELDNRGVRLFYQRCFVSQSQTGDSSFTANMTIIIQHDEMPFLSSAGAGAKMRRSLVVVRTDRWFPTVLIRMTNYMTVTILFASGVFISEEYENMLVSYCSCFFRVWRKESSTSKGANKLGESFNMSSSAL